jgi:hypothetical protein
MSYIDYFKGELMKHLKRFLVGLATLSLVAVGVALLLILLGVFVPGIILIAAVWSAYDLGKSIAG